MQNLVFYNPIIKYSLLQSLKLNVTFLLPVIAVSDDSHGQKIVSGFLFVVFNLLSVFYAVLLFRRKADLEEKSNLSSIGTLYRTLKTEMF